MKKSDFKLAIDKLGVNESDIYSYEENWPKQKISINGATEIVNSNIKWCTLTTKNGRVFYFKMNHLSKIIKTIYEPGYEFMAD